MRSATGSARSPRSCASWATRCPPARPWRRPAFPSCPAPASSRPIAQAEEAVERIGLPVIIKAIGGRRRARHEDRRDKSRLSAQLRPRAPRPRPASTTRTSTSSATSASHATSRSRCSATASRAIALGERECSIQRRHQKLVEEAPSVALDDERRVELLRAARKATAAIGYKTVGTLEFLLDEDKQILLHGDEHPHPGRAHRHRGGVRRRSGARADAPGGRRAAAPARRASARAATPSSSASTPRIPVTFAPSPGPITALNLPGGHRRARRHPHLPHYGCRPSTTLCWPS